MRAIEGLQIRDGELAVAVGEGIGGAPASGCEVAFDGSGALGALDCPF